MGKCHFMDYLYPEMWAFLLTCFRMWVMMEGMRDILGVERQAVRYVHRDSERGWMDGYCWKENVDKGMKKPTSQDTYKSSWGGG